MYGLYYYSLIIIRSMYYFFLLCIVVVYYYTEMYYNNMHGHMYIIHADGNQLMGRALNINRTNNIHTHQKEEKEGALYI